MAVYLKGYGRRNMFAFSHWKVHMSHCWGIPSLVLDCTSSRFQHRHPFSEGETTTRIFCLSIESHFFGLSRSQLISHPNKSCPYESIDMNVYTFYQFCSSKVPWLLWSPLKDLRVGFKHKQEVIERCSLKVYCLLQIIIDRI